MITFNEDHLAEELAYIVENDLLLHAVETELSEKKSVKVITNAKVEDIYLPGEFGTHSSIRLQSGENFKAKLLVSYFVTKFVSYNLLALLVQVRKIRN